MQKQQKVVSNRFIEIKPKMTSILIGYTDYGGLIMRDVPTDVAEKMQHQNK